VQREALFLQSSEAAGGRRFAIHHAPRGSARAAVVHLHAFAEEMNKSRRMVALASRALAEAGCAVLQVDLAGCGDSSGEFSEATWDGWCTDALDAARWLTERHAAPLWLWGHRAGCLLAAQAARRMAAPCHLLFWQPSVNGKAVLQQFLRLKAAAQMQSGSGSGAVQALKQALAEGQAVEIAGYELGAAVANGLEQASLEPPPGRDGARLAWLEVTQREPAALLPASVPALAKWRAAGWEASDQVLAGPSFWQTVEVEEAPALVDATVAAVTAETAAAVTAP
jgi:exosortase A-associated hydrolase 2